MVALKVFFSYRGSSPSAVLRWANAVVIKTSDPVYECERIERARKLRPPKKILE